VGRLAILFFGQNSRLVRTRNVLRSSEEQFRFIAEHAGDLVSVLTPDHRFRYASPSHNKYFAAETFADGAHWLKLVHPGDRGLALAFLDLLSSSPHSERAQLRIIPAGAPPQIVECEGNPVREDDGSLQMIVLLCRDLVASGEPKTDDLRGSPAAANIARNQMAS
jgi:PAS domain-containing protein